MILSRNYTMETSIPTSGICLGIPPWERPARPFRTRRTLTGAEKKALLNLLNAHSEIVGTKVFENFCMGFRLGALAILDILAGADQLFPED